MLYTRPQLLLLFTLLGAAAAGIGVGHWRARHSDLVDRLEQLDREPALADGRPGPSVSQPAAATSSPRERTRRPGRRAHPEKLAPAPVEQHDGPVDLNQAGVDELSRLPGIGPGLAQRILAAREAQGRFESVDDLRRVRGVGRVKLQRLRTLVTVAE
jgi:competence ComEA-like helix-hairpin-helix protein